jgi:hypothetical protein
MKGTCEQNEYSKNPKTDFTLSAKISQVSSEDTVTGHLAWYLEEEEEEEEEEFIKTVSRDVLITVLYKCYSL